VAELQADRTTKGEAMVALGYGCGQREGRNLKEASEVQK
jgi:hypothetical protein